VQTGKREQFITQGFQQGSDSAAARSGDSLFLQSILQKVMFSQTTDGCMTVTYY
jgi:hypothetical protein